jgi:hypothetical protein
MFGDLQPFRRFCNEASTRYEPWSHEGMAEMVKLAQAEGYNDFNPWSVPEAEKWKPHLDYRGVKVRSDWTSTVRLTDPDEYRQGKATRMRLLSATDPFECPVQPNIDQPVGGTVIGGTIIGGTVIGGTIIGGTSPGSEMWTVPMIGGGYTLVPKNKIPALFCQAPLTLALDKPLANGGKWLCATKEQLSPKKKEEGSALPLLALAAAAAYFFF